MKHIITITMGDAAGIGPEIAVKALSNKDVYESCIPVVIGDRIPLEEALEYAHSDLKLREIKAPEEAAGEFGTIDFINLNLLKKGDWTYKTVCKSSGEASFQYILKGIELAMKRRSHGVVTGPINKEAINLAGHHYSGHTEIFAEYTGSNTYGMLLASKKLRVIHVTTHVSMRNACDMIREHPEKVEHAIYLAKDAMEQLGIEQPRIAVAGLNAHSSENGLFGDEEEKSIIPAIEKCQKEGILAEGPVPPDTVFVKAMAGQYDVVVAMYHDQGHIPLKLSGFQMDYEKKCYTAMSGVNSTIGLPIIRTSVDHGTAFGKAGEGRANEESLVEAIAVAVQMADKRFPLAE
ncbi:4-hydroxythreonine-4-phosphate dehydrogenase PdxA [Lacrimispora sp. NSJ-141]|uniref:4-hydroxythreonine-4-phosphate dehydrogenase PdxA n=2 Tax=Lientehia hominis TaxID=2897778 RepID=A0AAP2WA91_9FIRM|nr:4-hydroxythreonine-4-phosphate dehydrogenase PdxA [Lientehia hominis]MCD2492972.1 4-hydroxythreonine-4-phosphate dehydrogenase PdxA [Lientehia hominis]